MKFRAGGVIRTYNVKGMKVVFRWPKMSDAADLARYVNRLSLERPPMITRTSPKMTAEKEKKYLKRMFKAMGEGKVACPLVEVDGKVAALTHAKKLYPNSRILKHQVEIGVGLDKNYRGLGIGHLIMEVLEEVSVKCLKAKVIVLWHAEYNKVARGLYEKHGFRETGRIPKAIRHKGKYYDEVLMCKVLV